jgi:hypothetical protein
MGEVETARIMEQFNKAFVEHEPALLADLVGADCVMEAVQPAPDGARYVGREACLAFWEALAGDRAGGFQPEEVVVFGDRATIRWRYRFGDGESDHVAGVNLMRVQDGRIVEALGYSKTPPDATPLADLVGAETLG